MSQQLVSLDLIHDNPWQTRQTYDPAYIQELADDIAENSLLQIPVARMAEGILSYQLAFGHCRLRALRLLHEQGKTSANMPLEIHRLTDEQMADFAWAENEKRRDTTPIERMHAIQKQMADFGWTQAEIGRRRGLSDAAVSNILRLVQLPDEIQTDLHAGKVSERQAMALLPYYSLPENLRQQAARSTWLPDPVKKAQAGAASDEVRQAVNDVVNKIAHNLFRIPLEHAFEGDGYQAPRCLDCPQHFLNNHTHYCAHEACFNSKTTAAKALLLAEASQITGLPIKTEDEPVTRAFYGVPQGVSLYPKDGHPGLLAQGCAHLRVRLDKTALPTESLKDKKFHNVVGILCANPDGTCPCIRNMAAAQQKLTPDQAAREAAEERQRAEEQARKERLADAFKTHLLQPTQQAILEMFRVHDLHVWRALASWLSNDPWDVIAGYDLGQCQAVLAEKLAEWSLSSWTIINDTQTAIARLNATRARLGLEALDLPEEAYANHTPAAKLQRRLERLQVWAEKTYETQETSLAAIEGNLANLEKIRREYQALSADQRTLPNFETELEAMAEALQSWRRTYSSSTQFEPEEAEDEPVPA